MALPKVNICLLGGGGVGKTSITLQFVNGKYSEGYVPTVEDYFQKRFVVDDLSIESNIIDTAGQEDFAAMRFRYYKEADTFIFTFALNDKASVKQMVDIIKEVQDQKNNQAKFIVAANKADLPSNEQKVKIADVEREYPELAGKIIKTSAKENVGINDVFVAAARPFLIEKGYLKAAADTSCNCLLI